MYNLTFAKILQALIQAKGQADIHVSGISMNPTLFEGDIVTVRSFEDYELGDIIVFSYKHHELLVHRLLKKENNRYFCKGDNSLRLEDMKEFYSSC